MLHSERPRPVPEMDRGRYDSTEKQNRLASFCREWHLPAPQYRYSRSKGFHYVPGIHSSVIVNDVEYSSTLSTNDVHPGWGNKNEAREAVASEVLIVLGLDPEDGTMLPFIPEES